MALSIDQANAVSRQYFDKTLLNIAYDTSPFFKKLKAGNQVKVKGGTFIQWPIRYKAMSGDGAVASVDPTAAVTYGVADSRTAAKSGWKFYFGNTRMTWKERVENTGEAQIVSLIKDKFTELQEDFEDQLTNDLYDTTAYTEDTSTGIAPLPFLVSAEAYAGIDPADAPRWKSNVYDGTEWTVLDLYSDDADKGHKSLYKAIVASTFGGKKPKFILTTEDILASLKEKIWNATKYEGTVDAETANMGFTNVTFEGTTILADPFCPSGYLFGLDMGAFEFQIHPDFNFLVKDWEALESYPNDLVKRMSFAGNVVMKHRHTSFVFNGITGEDLVAG